MGENAETPEPAKSPGSAGPAAEEVSPERPEIPKEAREMAMLCHLLGIVGFFAPLVIWLNAKDKHDFVNEHGRGAINYQISIMLYYLACWVLCFIIIGAFLLIALVVMHVVFVLIGAVRAKNGMAWQYPIAIRFLK